MELIGSLVEVHDDLPSLSQAMCVSEHYEPTPEEASASLRPCVES